TGSGSTAPAASGTVTVFAAASLTSAFTKMGQAFNTANPAAKVVFSFSGSNDLVAQIGQGAPADVFISADDANMAKLVAAGDNSGTPTVVARNSMAIIVETGKPKGITDLADLAKLGLIVVLCAPQVPCGKAAQTVLGNAKVSVNPRSLEANVKGVVTKVAAGEADAGIVFTTDVAASGQATAGVKIPDAQNTITNYPIVVTKGAPNASAARSFVDFVASPSGQTVLAEFGFLHP
ncbi:MAG: molybdate ABC transporter substrate-binding protein, partial [Ilumatobacteraceae bacterium]